VELDLTLPYATQELPGIGGQLRAGPDSFIVEEIPLYQASGAGQHLYVNITKEMLTTREVQRALAEAFDLPYNAVGFAGMKDKLARATQTFSLLVGHVDDAFLLAAPSRIVERAPVEVNWVRLHRNKLKKGHLLGNRFTITVSQPAVDGEDAVDRAQAVAAQLRRDGLPNYYGPQRLGQNGSNVRRGWELLRGEKNGQPLAAQPLARQRAESPVQPLPGLAPATRPFLNPVDRRHRQKARHRRSLRRRRSAHGTGPLRTQRDQLYRANLWAEDVGCRG
jgi:TruD family tRNA pseudouridine synthase